MSLELGSPPIDEVVCGFVFDQPALIDPVLVGRYWATREDFVGHEIHDPVADEAGLLFGPGAGRVWLVSSDGSWLVQLQPDRIFVNWRLRTQARYPGFTVVAERALEELERWRTFVEAKGGGRPEILRVELSKIDVLQHGLHWQDRHELAALLPTIAAALGQTVDDDARLSIRWTEPRAEGALSVAIDTARMRADAGRRAIRLESRLVSPVRPSDLGATLSRASEALNEVFTRLIPELELKRFA